MDFNDTKEEAKFRKKCREWLEKNATYKDESPPQNDDFANAEAEMQRLGENFEEHKRRKKRKTVAPLDKFME